MTGLSMELEAQNISFSYGDVPVFAGLNLKLLQGKITALVGANGSGKSTILKNLARILKPAQGVILLNRQMLQNYAAKDLARKMAVLPQNPVAPDGLRVSELVSYGRHPWQSGFGVLSDHDKQKIDAALELTELTALADRTIGSLSGGQRQRVWIALALAQDGDIILLDEPTTFLDMTHQLEVMQILANLNRHHGKTIIMVLHDLNQAARYSDHMIAIKQGKILHQGVPDVIMCAEVLAEVFGIQADFFHDPRTGTKICVPYATCDMEVR